MWDYREMRSSVSEVSSEALELNPDVKDSRLSMPEPRSRNSLVYVQNSSFTTHGNVLEHSEDLVGPESQKTTLSSQSSLELPPSGGLQKTHTKRVSFSNTPSVINADSDTEMRVRHRDSITSASTDSSEDSTSSGESRHSANSSASRGKFRAKLPVTTGTTRQISEMVQVAYEGSSISSCESDTRAGGHERKPSLVKHSEKEKSRSSVHRHERKSSDGSIEREYRTLKNVSPQHTLSHRVPPSPPPLKCPLNYQSIQEDEEVWQRNENFVPTSTYPYHPPQQITGQMSMHKMPMSPHLPRVYSDPSQERCMSPPPQERFKSPPPPSHSRIMSPPSHHRVLSPTSAPTDPWEYRTDLPPPPGAMFSHGEPGGRPQGLHTYQEQRLSKHTVAAPKTVSPKVPQNLSQSPPPPMPPPAPMAKPPSPGALPFHPPPLTSLSNPMFKQANVLSEECDSNASSPCPSESSPTTPRSMLAMPPAMPLLQNQYVSLQTGAMNLSKAPPKSGPEVTSDAPMSPMSAPQPSPPAGSMVSPSPMSQSKTQKNYPPPLSCGTTRTSSSPGVMSPVSPMSPALVQSPQMRNSAHGYEHFDQVRVRPGSQGSRGSTGSNVSRTSGGSVNCYPPPPPNPGAQPMSPRLEDSGKSLPFLDELSKRSSTGPPKKVPPQTLPKPTEGGHNSNMQNINGATTTLTNGVTPHNHKPEGVRPNSAPIKKGVPPPPPKRSETTRLSSDVSKVKDQDNVVPSIHDSSLYENSQECEGIMDINDLPPPPPELLAGLASDGNVKRGKPPPPPPKRSRETHLSQQT